MVFDVVWAASRSAALSLIGLAGVACATDDSGLPLDQAGGQDTASTGDSPQATGGEAMGCEVPLGAGACADVTICDVFTCGGKDAPFNHFGCARTRCESDTECAAGERCFAVALDTGCRAEAGACGDVEGACTCEGSTSCAGVIEAHCLPTGFYPASEDCDVSDSACDALEVRLGGLAAARAAFAEVADGQLVAQLDTCRERVQAAQQTCGQDVAP